MRFRCIGTSMLTHEKNLLTQGYSYIAGIDEVGRGPLAGPVTACALIMPPGLIIPGVTDSKALSPQKREELAHIIKEKATDYALGWADETTIDEINILQATYLAMSRAIGNLRVPPDALLIDGPAGKWLPDIPSVFIKGGDVASHSIAAASILAKVARDAFMTALHAEYPEYGFDTHKGYGTRAHRAAILDHGPCPAHRRSFLSKVQ